MYMQNEKKYLLWIIVRLMPSGFVSVVRVDETILLGDEKSFFQFANN